MAAARGSRRPLPLCSLNHISRNCSSVAASVEFYTKVLGFIQIKRPQSPPFDFDGAWLFNYGVGIHLLKTEHLSKQTVVKTKEIDPRADHISFQADDTLEVEERLKELNIKYLKQTVTEGGIRVQQIFFHDPDGHMIEICDCESLPIVPVAQALGGACPARLGYKRPEVIRCGSGMAEVSDLDLSSLKSPLDHRKRVGVPLVEPVRAPQILGSLEAHDKSVLPQCA